MLANGIRNLVDGVIGVGRTLLHEHERLIERAIGLHRNPPLCLCELHRSFRRLTKLSQP